MPRFLAILLITLATAACAHAPAAGPPAPFEFTQLHMGVEARIVLYAPDEPAASSAAAKAFARIADLDRALTDYRTDSELMRLCAHAGGPPVPVSPDLYFLLQRSIEISEASRGAFDITIGPVVRLWRKARREGHLPDPNALAAAKALVNYRNIALDPTRRTAQLAKPGMLLDLGGIAKGYAAQEAVKTLAAQGVPSALVALAGDIATGDPPPGKPGWTIAILAPENAPAPKPLTLHHTSISTSGDREQFLEVDGRRLSHIINPRTALASAAAPQVTTLSPDGATADALATAATLMPPEAAIKMTSKFPNTSILFQSPDGTPTQSWQWPETPPKP